MNHYLQIVELCPTCDRNAVINSFNIDLLMNAHFVRPVSIALGNEQSVRLAINALTREIVGCYIGDRSGLGENIDKTGQ